MPRELEDTCADILTAYFERRSATARAVLERPGLRDELNHGVIGLELLEIRKRDDRILKWYLSDNTPQALRLVAARRVLTAWHVERMTATNPFQLSRLLKFDLHYFHVLEFSNRLVEAVPVGIEPFSQDNRHPTVLEKRMAFADEMKSIWRRPKTDTIKIPDPPELLKRYFRLMLILSKPSSSAEPSQIPQGTEDLFKYQNNSEVERLVKRARVGEMAFPVEFEQAYKQVWTDRGDDDVDPPAKDAPFLERLMWHLEEIGDCVESKQYGQAAVMILACSLSSTVETITKMLRAASKKTTGLPFSQIEVTPPASCFDHRDWGFMGEVQAQLLRHFSSQTSQHPSKVFALSPIAQVEKLHPDEVVKIFTAPII